MGFGFGPLTHNTEHNADHVFGFTHQSPQNRGEHGGPTVGEGSKEDATLHCLKGGLL